MIIVLIDCTGHSVPGAFLTMITYSEIRKIIMDEMIYEPALILKQLNGSVKNVLHKNSDKTMIDDGLDAAVCKINYSTKTVSFSSSKISMFYVLDGKALVLKGDNHSIGYKDSNEHYDFSSHIINNCSGICFYLLTDGYTDQLGGKRRRRFGSKRFNELITRHHRKPFCDQRKLFIESLLEYKDSNDQVDDITVIGFRG